MKLTPEEKEQWLTPEEKEQWLDAAKALLDGEMIQFQTPDGRWKECPTIDMDYPHRRKPKPDPLAEFKAAHAAGKRVEIRTSYGWSALADPVFNAAPSDYRIAPWTLPDPPAGQKWHRTDWTEEMLPEGCRPLLESEMNGQSVSDVDWRNEYSEQKEWHKGEDFRPLLRGGGWFRTRRPLPTPPRMVALEACDVPPLSCYADDPKYNEWSIVESADSFGIWAWKRRISFADMQKGFILRPGDTKWRPCEKEAK